MPAEVNIITGERTLLDYLLGRSTTASAAPSARAERPPGRCPAHAPEPDGALDRRVRGTFFFHSALTRIDAGGERKDATGLCAATTIATRCSPT